MCRVCQYNCVSLCCAILLHNGKWHSCFHFVSVAISFWTLNSLCSNLCVKLCFFHIYTHISSRGQHILFLNENGFRSLLSSKVYYSCRWLNEGQPCLSDHLYRKTGCQQHHRVQSNMTCTSVLLWGENIVVSRMNSTLLDEDISSPLVQGTRPPPPLCVLWCLAADQSCSVQTLVTGFSRSSAQVTD